MSSTEGSLIITGWKRLANAASFSIYCLKSAGHLNKVYLYSFKVVAPQHCSSPLAKLGFNIFPASTLPSPFPRPRRICNSSINVIISPPAPLISFKTFCNRSSNSPRYFAPEINADKSNETTLFLANEAGTSFRIIRCASPSYSISLSSKDNDSTMMAVLPTPAGPTKAGLFFVLRLRI